MKDALDPYGVVADTKEDDVLTDRSEASVWSKLGPNSIVHRIASYIRKARTQDAHPVGGMARAVPGDVLRYGGEVMLYVRGEAEAHSTARCLCKRIVLAFERREDRFGVFAVRVVGGRLRPGCAKFRETLFA